MAETFTFDNTLSTDLALVRFHIADMNAEGNYLWDETITALLTSEGSVGDAVIASIKNILAQLAIPNFKEDWFEVDVKTAQKGYEELLKIKADEFGISISGLVASSSISQTYRADSDQYTSTTRETTTKDDTSIYDGS